MRAVGGGPPAVPRDGAVRSLPVGRSARHKQTGSLRLLFCGGRLRRSSSATPRAAPPQRNPPSAATQPPTAPHGARVRSRRGGEGGGRQRGGALPSPRVPARALPRSRARASTRLPPPPPIHPSGLNSAPPGRGAAPTERGLAAPWRGASLLGGGADATHRGAGGGRPAGRERRAAANQGARARHALISMRGASRGGVRGGRGGAAGPPLPFCRNSRCMGSARAPAELCAHPARAAPRRFAVPSPRARNAPPVSNCNETGFCWCCCCCLGGVSFYFDLYIYIFLRFSIFFFLRV